MAYVIAEPCVDVLDQSCVAVCPVDCIHFEEGTDRKLFIDPDECIDCGACEPECPVNSIFPAESVPAQWSGYIQIDADWYKDKASARTAVDAAKPRCGGRLERRRTLLVLLVWSPRLCHNARRPFGMDPSLPRLS